MGEIHDFSLETDYELILRNSPKNHFAEESYASNECLHVRSCLNYSWVINLVSGTQNYSFVNMNFSASLANCIMPSSPTSFALSSCLMLTFGKKVFNRSSSNLFVDQYVFRPRDQNSYFWSFKINGSTFKATALFLYAVQKSHTASAALTLLNEINGLENAVLSTWQSILIIVLLLCALFS